MSRKNAMAQRRRGVKGAEKVKGETLLVGIQIGREKQAVSGHSKPATKGRN
jgi:hypothetical protein